MAFINKDAGKRPPSLRRKQTPAATAEDSTSVLQSKSKAWISMRQKVREQENVSLQIKADLQRRATHSKSSDLDMT